jgi:hypothetical protein
MHFFVQVLTGRETAADCVQFSRSLHEKRVKELAIDITRLAQLTGLTVNACLRLQKYGWAHVSVIPKLASALGLEHANELLVLSDEGIGVRIERSDQFLRVLEETHCWKVVLRGAATRIRNGCGKVVPVGACSHRAICMSTASADSK